MHSQQMVVPLTEVPGHATRTEGLKNIVTADKIGGVRYRGQQREAGSLLNPLKDWALLWSLMHEFPAHLCFNKGLIHRLSCVETVVLVPSSTVSMWKVLQRSPSPLHTKKLAECATTCWSFTSATKHIGRNQVIKAPTHWQRLHPRMVLFPRQILGISLSADFKPMPRGRQY